MASTTLFNRSVRDAGEISTELRSFGSFRSVNKYDPNRVRSKHDDIFVNNDVEETIKAIEPAEGEQKKPSSNKERRRKSSGERKDREERKNRHERGDRAERKQRHERQESGNGRESKERRESGDGREGKERRESRDGRGGKERRESRDRHENKERREKTGEKNVDQKNGEDNDEEFMNYLSQRQNRRRKKKVDDEVDAEQPNTNEALNRRGSEAGHQTRSQSGFLKHKDENAENQSVAQRRQSVSGLSKEGSDSAHVRSSSRSSRRQRQEEAKGEEAKENERAKSAKSKFMLNADAFSALPPTPNNTNSNNNKRSPDLNKSHTKTSESDTDAEDAEVQVDTVKNQTSSIEKIDFRSEYFRLIKHGSTMQFLLTPAPQGKIINCKIRKGQGILSDMQFFLEDYSHGSKQNIELLMRTHCKILTAKVNHVITACNYDEFWTKSDFFTCGRITSNMSRKKWKLELQYNDLMSSSEILAVEYKQVVGEPRKITGRACLLDGATNLQRDKVTIVLKNRQPHYDHALRKFVLNYNGRAKFSSKHNFQIVDESYPDEILMQLGKVENGFYNCDFRYPFCALQAFGFALSSLCR